MNMKKQFLFLLVFVLLGTLNVQLFAQKEVHFDNGCNFKAGRTEGTYTLFDPSTEAEQMVDEILGIFRITKRPFTLKKSNVDNAQATMLGQERYLLYSGLFLRAAVTDAQTKWAAKGIFAHEIGHHVLLQDLTNTDPIRRRECELEADAWAASILARMGATREEALASILILKSDIDPKYYPVQSARIEGMESAYDKELTIIEKEKKVLISANKKPFQIDQSSFNRWSIVNKGAISSYYDDTKITFDISISPIYRQKKITVLLCSNDPNISIKKVTGLGTYLPYSSTMTIVWQYEQDNVLLINAITPNQFRVLVYDSEKHPISKISIRNKIGYSTLAITGLGIAAYSFKLKSNALNYYNQKYKATKSEEDYQIADKKYVASQYLLIGGSAIVAFSTALILNKLKIKREAKRAICFAPHQWEIEPAFVYNGSVGPGFRVRF
jgi:hypothetical protein